MASKLKFDGERPNEMPQKTRDWLVAERKSLGCEVKVDQMGNIFAIRPGSADRMPIAMGSHMDRQPAGGRYDGIHGIQAALEVLRTLDENNIITRCPIALIDWTNEEGARFPGATMASGVWSTKSSTGLEACWATQDKEGVLMKQALEDIGYLGETKCDYRENGLDIGVVTSVQGIKWFAVRVAGVEGHSGTTTPMPGGSDALVTTSRLITAVFDAALKTELAVATVGVIKSDTSNIRCSTDPVPFDGIISEEANGTSYTIQKTWGLPESVFHPNCIDAVRAAALQSMSEDQIMVMKSRACHDSAWTSRICPTSMIFVPSKEGISHSPNECTSPEHCSLGAQVLLDSVLFNDQRVKEGN
ncbi:Zn-dependent exopeptidase [Byssothecium circinans]|uniref:Zn-dependent exopeptidase n=1 Tax=Byssothecium circinans TaxID=147558 RepID=A0A6A5UC32_9PLEO|nr:Zn-dependent exopeptidase [Byssothecium circinans]